MLDGDVELDGGVEVDGDALFVADIWFAKSRILGCSISQLHICKLLSDLNWFGIL